MISKQTNYSATTSRTHMVKLPGLLLTLFISINLLLSIGHNTLWVKAANEQAGSPASALANQLNTQCNVAGTTHTFDWGNIAWQDPPTNDSYPWVQTFTNVDGSGVDMTVTIPRQHRDNNSGYMDTPGDEIDVYAASPEVLRFWHPDDTQIDRILVSFSEPILLDDLVFGGNRLNGSTFGTLEITAFDGADGTGNPVLPNTAVHPDPATITSVVRGTAVPSPANAALTITDFAGTTDPDFNAAFIISRQSYSLVGLTNIRNWAVIDYADAPARSVVWEMYGSSVNDPQTARDNLIRGAANSAYMGSFDFQTCDVKVAIGNIVWLDNGAGGGIPNDGIINGSEAGIDTVDIQLFASGDNPLTDTPIATTTTAGGGFYLFDNLDPGSYFVHIPASEFATGQPLANHFSTTGNGSSDSADDHADENGIDATNPAATGISSINYDLQPGTEPINEAGAGTYGGSLGDDAVNMTADFGFYPALRLGNLVWNDFDNDGRYDPTDGEREVGNVLVELLDQSGAPFLNPITGLPMQTTTNGAGIYLFEGLPAGTYIVRLAADNFDEPSDPLYRYVSSQNEIVPDPAKDVDNDESDVDDNGRNNPDPRLEGISSYPVTLLPNTEPITDSGDEDGSYLNQNSNLTVDFGVFELMRLGNLVWFDHDKDGRITPGEPGAAGVILNLLDKDGNPLLHPVSGLPITTTTDANGFYMFTSLYPGQYRVQIAPENFQPGGALEGYLSTSGSNDPDNDDNLDDNGIDDDEPWINGIVSEPVTLVYRSEPDQNADGDNDNNSNLTVDLGVVAAPTAVSLSSFTAVHTGNKVVELSWRTESEVDNFGFRLYRGTSSNFATAVEIAFVPTAVSGGTGSGASYQFTDTVANFGQYTYWLIDVETDGNTATHAPVQVNISPVQNMYLPLMQN